MRHIWILLVGALGACASAPTAEPVQPEAETPGNCTPKPEQASKAIAKPQAIGCSDRAQLVELTKACNKSDPTACYQIGVCHTTNALLLSSDRSKKAKTLAMAKKALRIACDGGLAEGCMVRAGLFEDQKTNAAARKAACADAVRACHLGHKIGCADCVMCGAD